MCAVKVVGTAIPFADDLGQYKLRWSLSSGEMLTISRPMEELNWESNLIFSLDGSSHGLVLTEPAFELFKTPRTIILHSFDQ